MANNKRKIGMFYEKKVGEYLENQGYSIVTYNYQYQTIEYFKPLEIDIIAIKNNVLYIFEVKYRKNYKNHGDKFFPIGEKKIKNLIACCENFLYFNPKFLNMAVEISGAIVTDFSIEIWRNLTF